MPAPYIKNKDLEQLVIDFRNNPNKENQLKLANAFVLIATNLTKRYRMHDVDVQDAIQESVLTCFLKIHNFDAAKGGCFSYVTTISLNAMRQLYRGSKSFNDLREKYKRDMENK